MWLYLRGQSLVLKVKAHTLGVQEQPGILCPIYRTGCIAGALEEGSVLRTCSLVAT